MMWRAMLVVVMVVVLAGAITPVWGESTGFPGKGSKADWERAARMYNQANALKASGDIDKAIKLYRQSIAIYPYDDSFYANLANAYGDGKGDWQKAEQSIRKALSINPSEFKNRFNLAAILAEQAKYSEAKRLVESMAKQRLTDKQRADLDQLRTNIERAALKKTR